MPSAIQSSYEISNHPELLPLIEEVRKKMRKDTRKNIIDCGQRGWSDFPSMFQISKAGEAQTLTIGQLCASAEHETISQALDIKAIRGILFGTNGLVHKTGGGAFPYLQEDIEVGFICDFMTGERTGPIVTSGRNRTLALQAFIMGAAEAINQNGVNQVPVRVTVVNFKTAQELQARIISANMGSRDMSRAEARERMASASGLDLRDTKGIFESGPFLANEDAFRGALAAYIKLEAGEQSLGNLSPDQWSDCGTSLFNKLKGDFTGEGKFTEHLKAANGEKWMALLTVIRGALPAVNAADMKTAGTGAYSARAAKVLQPMVSPAVASRPGF